MKYAAELFPVLNDYKNNPLETLSKLRKSGFSGIEMFGVSDFCADELKQMIFNSGLELTGYQLPWNQLQGTKLTDTIAYQKKICNKHIIIDALGGPWESGHKVTENTVAMWEKHAEQITQINQELRNNGMDLTYHTHAYDYGDPIEGTIPSLEILLKNIPTTVGIEIDTGNCIEGHKSPIKYLANLTGRTQFLHCKPYATSLQYEVSLGAPKDENDWPAILNAAELSGTKWLVVEPESVTLGNIFDVMKDSLNQLKLLSNNKTRYRY